MVSILLYLSLTSSLDGVGGQLHAPSLYSRKRLGTHCIGGWVSPRAGLDGCGKPRPHRDTIPGPSSPYRVAIPAELSRPTVSHILLIFFFFPVGCTYFMVCLCCWIYIFMVCLCCWIYVFLFVLFFVPLRIRRKQATSRLHTCASI